MENPLKIIFVGEAQVGKTAIITQYTENRFEEEYMLSMNSDKRQKEVELTNGKKIKIEIWDTIGQIGYRAVNKIFMKNTKIALMVYDITNQKTFDVLNEFYEQINDVNGKGNVYFVVIGNKSDLYDEQIVSKEEGKEYANKIKALFYETSATDHECIENVFKDVVNNYVKETKPELLDEVPENKDESGNINDKNEDDINNDNNEIKNNNERKSFHLNNNINKKQKKDCKC